MRFDGVIFSGLLIAATQSLTNGVYQHKAGYGIAPQTRTWMHSLILMSHNQLK
jgi:hypothetical protein